MMRLETERLLFRDHALEDLDAFCQMEADPEVRRYVGGTLRKREDAERRFLNGLSSAPSDLALRAMVLKETGDYIGRAGIYPHFGPSGPIEGEASLSFYLMPAYWGHGFATEAGAAFIRYGFESLGLRRIVTTIDADNKASRRVLEKLGFTLINVEQGHRTFENFEIRNSFSTN